MIIANDWILIFPYSFRMAKMLREKVMEIVPQEVI